MKFSRIRLNDSVFIDNKEMTDFLNTQFDLKLQDNVVYIKNNNNKQLVITPLSNLRYGWVELELPTIVSDQKPIFPPLIDKRKHGK